MSPYNYSLQNALCWPHYMVYFVLLKANMYSILICYVASLWQWSGRLHPLMISFLLDAMMEQ